MAGSISLHYQTEQDHPDANMDEFSRARDIVSQLRIQREQFTKAVDAVAHRTPAGSSSTQPIHPSDDDQNGHCPHRDVRELAETLKECRNSLVKHVEQLHHHDKVVKGDSSCSNLTEVTES